VVEDIQIQCNRKLKAGEKSPATRALEGDIIFLMKALIKKPFLSLTMPPITELPLLKM